ncbi:hypothetical protein GALL_414080 [mine drainage metagenome]|uniref:Uncharacterized protein n=1 Tax=mine drainage metagenome TaxID=410659 RepID=A0A1J5QLK2_9ZZZZ
MEQHQFLQRQKAVLAARCRQGDEARHLLRHRQQGLQGAPVGDAFQVQREAKAGVGDKGERVRRVDRQRRQDREHLIEEVAVQKRLVALGQLGAGQQGDTCAFHLFLQFVPDQLLCLQQAAGVVINLGKLILGRQAVGGQKAVARPGQFAQARDADGVEFVKVGGRDRQKAQALQQRHTRIARLVHHAPVERQPRQFAVEKAVRPCDFRCGQGHRLWERRFQEICFCHLVFGSGAGGG